MQRTKFAVLRTVSRLLLVHATILCPTAPAQFIISAEGSCFGGNTYSYNFTRSITADFTVKVSRSAVAPDLRMRLVSSPRDANLILVDDFDGADMKVCKSRSLTDTSIRVSPSAVVADISVALSRSVVIPDYHIFIDSERLSDEEAAALFAVIWEANRQGNEED